MIVKLTREEVREARTLAYSLAIHWYGVKKNKALLGQAITGVCGEMAAIKYFNNVLGAEPRIKLNKDYKNGCDGGFDFRHPTDLTWDVKVVTNGSQYVLKTKAQCVIGVQRIAKNTYALIGYAPVSRLRESLVEDWKWIPIQTIKQLLPQAFPHSPIRAEKKPGLKQIHREVVNALLPIQWKLLTQ